MLIPLRGIQRHPLARGRLFSVLRRFVFWQLRSRLHSSVDVPFVNQARLRVSRGMNGLTGNIYTGLHEFESMGFLLHLLRSDDLFVDVGANAGSYTVLAGKAIGCRVVAVEPADAALHALHANIALNDIADRVEVHAVIAADSEGTLPFTCDQGPENHVAWPSDPLPSTRSMPVQTLDRLLNGRVPCLIKLDVEGYELKALRGASTTLAASGLRALIVEINGSESRYQLSAKELIAVLQRHGFSGYQYDPLRRSLHRIDPLSADGNVIFLRDSALIASLVAAAPAFSLPGWDLSI